MPDLLDVIKTAAMEAYKASSPAAIVFGTVQSVSPIKINIEQKLTLDSSHLVLTSLVSDFDVDMTEGGITDTYTVKLGLSVNDKVILLRVQGGQKYIVLDRVR